MCIFKHAHNYTHVQKTLFKMNVFTVKGVQNFVRIYSGCCIPIQSLSNPFILLTVE